MTVECEDYGGGATRIRYSLISSVVPHENGNNTTARSQEDLVTRVAEKHKSAFSLRHPPGDPRWATLPDSITLGCKPHVPRAVHGHMNDALS